MKLLVLNKAFDGGVAVYPDVEYGQSLSELIDRYAPHPSSPVEVLVNNVSIRPRDLANFCPVQSDTIVIRPRVGFGIGAIAAETAISSFFINLAFNIAIAYIGGLIVKALTPKPGTTDMAVPAIWDAHTMQRESAPLPRYYGRNRVYGNIIGAWRSVVQSNNPYHVYYLLVVGGDGSVNSWGQEQTLNLLVDLGEGPVEGIVAGTVRINEQDITNFYGVSYVEKKGELNQTAAAGLTEFPVEYSPEIVVTMAGGAQTYTVPVRDMDVVNVGLCFPKGVNHLDKGSSKYTCVHVKIEMAEAGSGIWNTLLDGTITAKTLRPIYAMYRNTGTYEGGAPVDISGWDGVDIRVTKVDTTHHVDGDNMTEWFDELRLSTVQAIYSTAFAFPKSAYVYVTALPSDKLSGALKFDCIQDGAIVNTYDGSSWTLQYSDNPAWVLLDVATQPVITGGPGTYAIDRYLGLDPTTQVDLDSVWALAQFCDGNANDGAGGTEKRFIFSGGIVQQSDVWRTILSICDSIRCAPVWDGQRLSFVIDRASTPVQMFSAGNIVQDSLKQTYTSQTDRASEIEVRYRDEDQDYDTQSITVVDATRESEGRAVALDLPYATRQTEAWRYGYFKLLQNRLLLRSIEFGVDVEGLLCTVGDSFYFQHDTIEPESLLGGRVVSATNNTIVVNRDDCNLAGSLKVLVRVYNPATGVWAFEDHTVDSVSGMTITITDTWTINPRADDVFIIGTTTAYKQQYTVTNLAFHADKTATVSAVEYDADVYAVDTDAPVLQATGLTTPASARTHIALPTLDNVRTVTPDDGSVVFPGDDTVTINVAWTSNDPGAGSVAWDVTDGGYPIEIRHNNVLYPIASDNTSLRYIYWKPAAPYEFSATDTLSDVAAAGGTLLAVNEGGTVKLVLASYDDAYAIAYSGGDGVVWDCGTSDVTLDTDFSHDGGYSL